MSKSKFESKMSKFESKGRRLYIDGKKVLRGWESFAGWYWFATAKEAEKVKHEIEPGKVIEDTRWFGLVQGFDEEWGTWYESDMNHLIKTNYGWKIRKTDLPYAGRRNNRGRNYGV